MVRAFLAVEIPEEIRRRIEEHLAPLRRADLGVKWVDRGNLHLTLRFLGELEEAEIARLKEAVSTRLAGAPRPRVTLAGIGRFPEKGRDIRVIWAGLRGDLASLKSLWERAQASARDIGLERDEHGFSPHVTVGRVKSRDHLETLRTRLEALASGEFGEHVVDRVVLFESRLSSAGPAYTEIGSWPLGS
jgi:2'-5' RNA ligase